MFNAWLANARADTLNTPGNCSPATLYKLGIIRSNPCDAVNVVVNAPADKEPCTAPAAPASDCISVTCTVCPKIFSLPSVAHSSTCSGITDDGVIG